MPATAGAIEAPTTTNFDAFAQRADYSLLESLRPDPQARADGRDHQPHQVFSGQYVPVTPTPLPQPRYVASSASLFQDLGLGEALARDERFQRLFSGDISAACAPMRRLGLGDRLRPLHLRHGIHPAVPVGHRQWLWRWPRHLRVRRPV